MLSQMISLTSKLPSFVIYWMEPGANLKGHKRAVLDQLVTKGLVVPTKRDPAICQLSDDAHHILAERGAGISGG